MLMVIASGRREGNESVGCVSCLRKRVSVRYIHNLGTQTFCTQGKSKHGPVQHSFRVMVTANR
jgi:hypothetical protein